MPEHIQALHLDVLADGHQAYVTTSTGTYAVVVDSDAQLVDCDDHMIVCGVGVFAYGSTKVWTPAIHGQVTWASHEVMVGKSWTCNGKELGKVRAITVYRSDECRPAPPAFYGIPEISLLSPRQSSSGSLLNTSGFPLFRV